MDSGSALGLGRTLVWEVGSQRKVEVEGEGGMVGERSMNGDVVELGLGEDETEEDSFPFSRESFLHILTSTHLLSTAELTH